MADRYATVHNARSQHGAITKLSRLVENLQGKFASWHNDQNQRLCGHLVNTLTESVWVGPERRELLGLAHELAQDWNQVSRGLARS